MSTTNDEVLAAVNRRIDRLQTRLHAAVARPGIERHIRAVRQAEASARAAAAKSAEEADEKLGQLKMRLDVAEHSVAAEVATDQAELTAAVEAELQRWDAYLERLQTKAARQTGTARNQAEAAIGELRRRRIDVAERVAELKAAPEGRWQQRTQRLAAARAELEQKADELSTKLDGGDEDHEARNT